MGDFGAFRKLEVDGTAEKIGLVLGPWSVVSCQLFRRGAEGCFWEKRFSGCHYGEHQNKDVKEVKENTSFTRAHLAAETSGIGRLNDLNKGNKGDKGDKESKEVANFRCALEVCGRSQTELTG